MMTVHPPFELHDASRRYNEPPKSGIPKEIRTFLFLKLSGFHPHNRACIVPSAAATECTRVAVGELVEVPRGELGRIAESDLLVSQLLAGASTDLVKSLSAIDNNYLFLVPAVNPGLRFIL